MAFAEYSRLKTVFCCQFSVKIGNGQRITDNRQQKNESNPTLKRRQRKTIVFI